MGKGSVIIFLATSIGCSPLETFVGLILDFGARLAVSSWPLLNYAKLAYSIIAP